MYIHRCILLLLVAFTISWLTDAASNYIDDDFDFDSANNLLLDELTKSCPSDGIPVCGYRFNRQYVIFPNECLLEEMNKDILMGVSNFQKIPLKQCFHDCKIQCPKHYKPICALNLKTLQKQVFYNLCEVTKYACKTNMDYHKLHLSECENLRAVKNFNKSIEKRSKSIKRRPIPCTNIFKPVCGSYLGVKSTFRNECLLNAENVKFDRDWRIVKTGICSEDYANARQTKEKPPKRHSIRKRSYDYANRNQYDTNNFVDYKSESHVPNNGVYVYMPTAFQTQFLNQIDQPITVNKAYDEILQKIISLPTPEEDSDHHDVSKDQEYGKTENKPIPFDANNSMNNNYIPDPQSMNKPTIPIHQPSYRPDDNKDFYYTFEKVEPNRETLPMGFKNVQTHIETEPMVFKNVQKNRKIEPKGFENVQLNHENVQLNHKNVQFNHENVQLNHENVQLNHEHEVKTETEQMTLEKLESSMEMRQVTELPMISFTDMETTLATAAEISSTSSPPNVPKKIEQYETENNYQNIIECKFGSIPICGVLADGKVQTFTTICEMMAANVYLTSTWEKLHEGICESCKYDCVRDYQPICVTRNGINYTMVNDCYYNMGICLDKKSKWSKIANGECERLTRIPDKYENSKPGFPYTSSYFASEASVTTEIPSLKESSSTFTTTYSTSNIDSNIIKTNKPFRTKSRKPKTRKSRKSSSRRVVHRRSSCSKCHSNVDCSNALSKEIMTATTKDPINTMSSDKPYTDSYIMSLVNDKRKFSF